MLQVETLVNALAGMRPVVDRVVVPPGEVAAVEGLRRVVILLKSMPSLMLFRPLSDVFFQVASRRASSITVLNILLFA